MKKENIDIQQFFLWIIEKFSSNIVSVPDKMKIILTLLILDSEYRINIVWEGICMCLFFVRYWFYTNNGEIN
jgi:hypothetical protein